ncbi:glycosyltransferase [Azospirillum isscasi]|uniref:Glycosyltransferase n=1 Tax=Azospirillum isscasi TaxID=3053926 RepID=A0ABU0WIL5_9PROT|nr:glycosyltransferase [Azospirillum isscasi]MDQ2104061.1 glycosyltransferase [Azospirillum isscasi]
MEVLRFSPDDFSHELLALEVAKLIKDETPPAEPIIFHGYWNGTLNEKHLISVKSCYLFNVRGGKNKIVIWTQNCDDNAYLDEIRQYAEVRAFSERDECRGTFLDGHEFGRSIDASFYSDIVRYILLYKYGGVWFDLDCLFLRSVIPLLNQFPGKILAYRWEQQNYPNGAIYVSPTPLSETMKRNIEFIQKRGCGWGFQQAGLVYDTPMDILVLPCPWFDAGWIDNPVLHFNGFMKASPVEYDLDTFFPGAFCFHWHNKWFDAIEPASPMDRLARDIDRRLSLES